MLYEDLSRRKQLEVYIINVALHKFKHRHAKHALDFGNCIFRLKIKRIKECYY
jgi:hypothetical protein